MDHQKERMTTDLIFFLIGPQTWGLQKPWCALVYWGWWMVVICYRVIGWVMLGVSQIHHWYSHTAHWVEGCLIGFVILNWCCVVSLFCRCFFLFVVPKFWIGGLVTEILRRLFFVAFRFGTVWHMYRQPSGKLIGTRLFHHLKKTGENIIHDIIDGTWYHIWYHW